MSHLDSRVGLLRVEAYPDREEVVRHSVTGELHAPGFVGSVYHRKLPEKNAALFVVVVTVTLGNDRGPGTVAAIQTIDIFIFY
jgi:hypothetical protein